MENLLKTYLGHRRQDKSLAICSVCSSNRCVLESALENGSEKNALVLIEATANQVNQYGGYTGLRPADYVREVCEMADRAGLSRNNLILGGDHLGPLTWQNEPAESAMVKAEELIGLFVSAGCTKIHIDTSMRLGDDEPDAPLKLSIVAERSARLAKAAKKAFSERRLIYPDAVPPVYVIGSEVPVPGGARGSQDKLSITSPDDFGRMMQTFREVYLREGLADVWNEVVAVVVQPGVEFSDDSVAEYDRDKARALTEKLREYPGVYFEGHSTDYQQPEAFHKMIEDGVAILKVGPALTFEVREGLSLLENIERELCVGELSDFRNTLDAVMLSDDRYWKDYYHGTAREVRLKRFISYSDRCRYYIGNAPVVAAAERLMRNLSGVRIPMPLLKLYLPREYELVRAGVLKPEPKELLKSHIRRVINQYPTAFAASLS